MFFSLKKSVPRIFDEAMIHQEREPSNVDEEGWKRSESWNEDRWKLREGGKRRKARRVESWPILGRSTGRYTEPTVNHASVAIGLNFLRLRVPKLNSYTGNNCLWERGNVAAGT